MANSFQDLTLEEINTLTIKDVCERAVALGQDRVIWQHPLNDQVEAYCKSKKYTISCLPTINPPSKLGQQYLIYL